MPIYIGNTFLTNLKIGNATIDAVYVGNTQVYPSIPYEDIILLVFQVGAEDGDIMAYNVGTSNFSFKRIGIPNTNINISASITGTNTGSSWTVGNSGGTAYFNEYIFTLVPFYWYTSSGHGERYCTGNIPIYTLTSPNSSDLLYGTNGSNLYSINVTGATASYTSVFTIPGSRTCTKDLICNKNNGNFIMITYSSDTGHRLTELTSSGTIVKEISTINKVTSTSVQLDTVFQSGNKLYGIAGGRLTLYEVATDGLVPLREINQQSYDLVLKGAARVNDFCTIGLP